MLKKITCLLLSLILTTSPVIIFAENGTNYTAEEYKLLEPKLQLDCKSAVLMEAKSGTVLYSSNQNTAYSPASVTKIMTLLLAMEALDNEKFALTDTVNVSAYATSMGGSQVYLREGESITVEDLIKCVVIASANDAAVALAELVAGSEDVFISMMNERATELGMKNTHFENVTGLDDTTENHVTSAMDIAIMSRELIKHELILKYSSIWQDTIRNGEFTLTNTNRLVRFYDGCNGLKTGSTEKAGFCMSATAEREGMQLIAVVMGAPSRDTRNGIARELLDFGFSNYALLNSPRCNLEKIPVLFGNKKAVEIYADEFLKVVNKSDIKRIESFYETPENIEAPMEAGTKIGSVKYMLGDVVVGQSDICLGENAEKISFADIYLKILLSMLGCSEKG